MIGASNAFLRSALLSVLALGFAAPIAGGCGGPAKQGAPKELSPRDIMQRYKPAIVRVESKAPGHVSVGTGFFVSPEGRIATNLHVIAGATELRVKLSDESEHEVTRVIAIDTERDLAIIQIDAGRAVPTVLLGDSDRVEAGDAVIAVGNPMNLDYTVSDGLISSKRPVEDIPMLQISAPISQGSSGGPLFNSFGQVIGVARMVSKAGQNLNFGVPVNFLKPMVAHDGGESMEEFAKRFSQLRRSSPRVIKTDAGVVTRKIPEHDVAILKDCSREHVYKVFSGIQRAIELGAPLYNDGDHQACFNIYEQTAAHFEKDPEICKGMRDALGAGLLRAETESHTTHKAWAMRDTFDGLLKVIVALAQQSQ